MITTNGVDVINRFIADGFGEEISIGCISAAPSPSDSELYCETFRALISSRSYDPVSGVVSFKSEFPLEEEYVIREVGLWGYSTVDPLITIIDDFTDSELPSGATSFTSDIMFSADGTQSIVSESAPSGLNHDIQLEGYSLSFDRDERFKIVCHFEEIGGSSPGPITLKASLMGGNSSLYEKEFDLVNGFNLLSVQISDMVKLGEPEFSEIAGISLEVEGSINDSRLTVTQLRKESSFPEGLISRAVLPEPIVKPAGQNLDIEFPLRISF